MRTLFTTLLVLVASLAMTQIKYPIVQKDCYVKAEGGLFDNLVFSESLHLAFWGMDHRRFEDSKEATYLREGEHRYLIDSAFRQLMLQLQSRLGKEVFCQRLRLSQQGFKYYTSSRPSKRHPALRFEFQFHLHCADIQYIRQAKKELVFKYHLAEDGQLVRNVATYWADNFFENCHWYENHRVAIAHRLQDSFRLWNVTRVSVNRLDSVNYKVSWYDKILPKTSRQLRYSLLDSSFHELPRPPKARRMPLAQPRMVDQLIGRFTGFVYHNAYRIHDFEVKTRVRGKQVDTSHIKIATLESPHMYRAAPQGADALVEVFRREPSKFDRSLDTIDHLYFLASNARGHINSHASLERLLYEQLTPNVDSSGFQLFDTDRCADLTRGHLQLQLGFSNPSETKTLSTHLWLFTTHKQRSLVGPISLVFQYDTLLAGSYLAKRQQLEVLSTYSFEAMGTKSIYSKSLPNSISIQVADVAPDRIKVTINGPGTRPWLDLLPPPQTGRVNPNVYPPLLRLRLQLAQPCDTAKMLIQFDQAHLDTTTFHYVDYFCDGAQTHFPFQRTEVLSGSRFDPQKLPPVFQNLSPTQFHPGDTVTLRGTSLLYPKLTLLVPCYGRTDSVEFTKLIPIPKSNFLAHTCEKITFIFPAEIPYDKSGFPSTMYPISGRLQSNAWKQGLTFRLLRE